MIHTFTPARMIFLAERKKSRFISLRMHGRDSVSLLSWNMKTFFYTRYQEQLMSPWQLFQRRHYLLQVESETNYQSSRNMPDGHAGHVRQTYADVQQRALTLPILSGRFQYMKNVRHGRQKLPDMFADHELRKMSSRGSKCPAEN